MGEQAYALTNPPRRENPEGSKGFLESGTGVWLGDYRRTGFYTLILNNAWGPGPWRRNLGPTAPSASSPPWILRLPPEAWSEISRPPVRSLDAIVGFSPIKPTSPTHCQLLDGHSHSIVRVIHCSKTSFLSLLLFSHSSFPYFPLPLCTASQCKLDLITLISLFILNSVSRACEHTHDRSLFRQHERSVDRLTPLTAFFYCFVC